MVTFGAIVKVCCEANDIPRAIFYLESMQRQGIPVNSHVYSKIISHFAKNKDPESAVLWLTKMLDAGAKGIAHIPLISFGVRKRNSIFV